MVVGGGVSQGPSALHRACEKGHSDAACALVDLGADVNCLTCELSTPLHLAVGGGCKGACAPLFFAERVCSKTFCSTVYGGFQTARLQIRLLAACIECKRGSLQTLSLAVSGEGTRTRERLQRRE